MSNQEQIQAEEEQDKNSRRGFASLPKEDVQEIAQMDGKSRGMGDNDDTETDKGNTETDLDFVPDGDKSGIAPELAGT